VHRLTVVFVMIANVGHDRKGCNGPWLCTVGNNAFAVKNTVCLRRRCAVNWFFLSGTPPSVYYLLPPSVYYLLRCRANRRRGKDTLSLLARIRFWLYVQHVRILENEIYQQSVHTVALHEPGIEVKNVLNRRLAASAINAALEHAV